MSSSSRTTRGLQENNNQAKDGTTNTVEDKCQTTEDPNKAPLEMWKDSLQDQERHKVARNTTAAVYNKDTAKERATEDHTTSDPLQPTKAPPTLQESEAPHTTKGAHILQKYILEEATGTEKAHTGREYMLSLEQRFTYTPGQTSSDSCLGDRPMYNQLEEKDNTQD